MSRMTVDCRTLPSESGCTLTISGEEDDVLRAAVAHAVDAHGHTDGEELRSALRASLVPAAALDLQPGAFAQLIDFRSDRIDEFRDRAREWAEAIGPDRTARWYILAADRDDTGRYLEFVAFPDHDAAMANSKHPVTGRFAERLRELSDGEVGFRDLDVLAVEAY